MKIKHLPIILLLLLGNIIIAQSLDPVALFGLKTEEAAVMGFSNQHDMKVNHGNYNSPVGKGMSAQYISFDQSKFVLLLNYQPKKYPTTLAKKQYYKTYKENRQHHPALFPYTDKELKKNKKYGMTVSFETDFLAECYVDITFKYNQETKAFEVEYFRVKYDDYPDFKDEKYVENQRLEFEKLLTLSFVNRYCSGIEELSITKNNIPAGVEENLLVLPLDVTHYTLFVYTKQPIDSFKVLIHSTTPDKEKVGLDVVSYKNMGHYQTKEFTGQFVHLKKSKYEVVHLSFEGTNSNILYHVKGVQRFVKPYFTKYILMSPTTRWYAKKYGKEVGKAIDQKYKYVWAKDRNKYELADQKKAVCSKFVLSCPKNKATRIDTTLHFYYTTIRDEHEHYGHVEASQLNLIKKEFSNSIEYVFDIKIPKGTTSIRFFEVDKFRVNLLTTTNEVSTAIDLLKFPHRKTAYTDPLEWKGTCLSGNCQSGYGKKNVLDGTYEGGFRNGKFNGKGMFIFSKGRRKAVGNFVDGMLDGYGEFICPAFSYKGQFANGEFYGKGTMIWNNGEKYVGNFVENLCHGQGVYTMSNNAYFKGVFQKGKLYTGDCYNANNQRLGWFINGYYTSSEYAKIQRNNNSISNSQNFDFEQHDLDLKKRVHKAFGSSVEKSPYSDKYIIKGGW